jgi:hypothetical protein
VVRAAWRTKVDILDQLGLEPDVDVVVLRLMRGRGRCRRPHLILRAKNWWLHQLAIFLTEQERAAT